MLDQLLGGSKGAMIGKLAGQLSLGQPQAGGFFPQAMGLLQGRSAAGSWISRVCWAATRRP